MGLVGGLCIGLAANTLLLLNGDVMGASGIANSFLHPQIMLRDSSNYWKVIFAAAFLNCAAVFLAPQYDWAEAYQATHRNLSTLAYVVAGFLVGFGTCLSNGCTSGHGICGLGRMNPRSFVSVLTFMTTGIVTAITTKPGGLLAFQALQGSVSTTRMVSTSVWIGRACTLAAILTPLFHWRRVEADMRKIAAAWISGTLFAIGLFVSGMVYPAKLFNFLDLSLLANGTWDPSLAVVMGGGVGLSFLAYQSLDEFRVVRGLRSHWVKTPVAMTDERKKFDRIPTDRTIDWKLILGAALFGVGWGLTGVCPGPAMWLGAAGVEALLMVWFPAYYVGAFLADQIKNRPPKKATVKGD